ncbi:galactosyltransferase-related protein [Corynebacterium massiliense]|uniref:Glycosyltransferase n=1 Tax=Corynebacterium massiliense DSM 45435 TaxID=1121364 RepID=A0ABY7UD24_9CORY|nr:galactosyltransferase-related protein [Corynebacterium massiliense]WCZ33362.1 hypothetical protein CMASS_09755 [Corynebacterium massiliense DSM 45435]
MGKTARHTTIVTLGDAGRTEHLVNQQEFVQRYCPGVRHILVALADHAELSRALPDVEVVAGDAAHARSLAAARNQAGDLAARDADTDDAIIFLDADCLPGPGMADAYRAALDRFPDAVVSGPVTYLEKGGVCADIAKRRNPHPLRPDPEKTHLATDDEYKFFWSLSFAVRVETWRRIRSLLGGFDQGYTGYGGEDTDFAFGLRSHSVAFAWAARADAYHQWHPVSSPPVEHLRDIAANATRFHSRWGVWPMDGWLKEFARRGLIRWHDDRIEVTDD